MLRKTRSKNVKVAPNDYQPTKAELEKVEPPLKNRDGSPATLEEIAQAMLQPVRLLTTENPRHA